MTLQRPVGVPALVEFAPVSREVWSARRSGSVGGVRFAADPERHPPVIVPRRPRLLPDPDLRESTFLGDLLRRETVGGTIALGAAAVAVVWANSPWGASYDAFRHHQLGPLDLEHWGADGALTLFFFVAGLELKREFVVGSLRRPADAAVPVVAAACGVAVPALVYLAVNAHGGDPEGWAV